ncbi:SLC13 family permease [Rhodococcus sp. NPDC057529]|uniref:SLC13 family permease n=1 Tax=Rhodococcus sp. NPDC057529 TaxID=3346158 RepID=UPI00366A5E26
MTLHIVSILVLIAAFVLATVTPLNLGAIAFVGVFVVGSLLADLPSKELLSGFPGNLFIVLVGVTYLFNIASANGAVDWLVGAAVRLVKGRNLLIPWIMFGAAALFSAIGAVFAVPIVAPIALAFAARNRISQLLMGLLVIHGCMAGALSPISVYGVIVQGVLDANGYPSNPTMLFLIGFAANLVAAIVVFLVIGARTSMTTGVRRSRASRTLVYAGGGSDATPATGSGPGDGPAGEPDGDGPDPGLTEAPGGGRITLEIALTFAAIAALVLLGVAFNLDIGLLAITLAIAVGVYRPQQHKAAIAAIPWPVVLLVCGVLTYVGVLDTIGTIDFVGEAVTAIGMPLAAALVLAYVGAVISAFATSSGVIAALVPLVIPLLSTSNLDPLAVVAVLAVASTIVDVSPFSTNGAVVVANATPDRREKLFRQLMIYGAVVVLVAPPLLWGAFILPAAL